MLVENNPFTPSFDRTPPFMAGLKLVTADLAKAFRGNGNDPYLQTLFMGARGTGKTALLMAGLPHQISQLVNSDAVSFLRRSTMVVLGRIDDAEIEEAFARTVEEGGKSIDGEALAECVRATEGFPYMMQLVGFRAWDASDEAGCISPADAHHGILAAKADLERQILIPTWANLSNGDKVFCHSLAQGNHDAKSISRAMDKRPNYVSKYKQRLLEQGVIEQDPYARLRFSLPGFEQFVRTAAV